MINLREIIQAVIRNHPPECIFAPNAVDTVMKEIQPWMTEKTLSIDLINFLIVAIQGQEIYCPHEGIDRRDEYEQTSKAR